MKIKNTNSIQKIRNYIFFPILALATLFIFTLNLRASVLINKAGVVQQEKISVKGKVLDANAVGIDGVLVKDLNSETDTVSDAEGEFTLSLDMPATISFSKFGFETLEKVIAENDSNLMVMLTRESNDTIVDSFNAGISVNRDNKWILDSLSTIIDNYPLYIIDNIQKEKDFDVKMLDAEEVLSIEILKDSIASGVYGVNGEGGAVKIITKNFNDLINQVPMQLNSIDTTSSRPSLKERYEVYKDSMNARNERLHKMSERGLKNRSTIKIDKE